MKTRTQTIIGVGLFCLTASGFLQAQTGTAPVVKLPAEGPGSLRQAYQDYTDKKYAVAEAELKGIIQKAPNALEAHEMLVDIYLGQNQLTDAVPEMETVLRLKPTDTTTRDNLGIVYLQTGDTDKAAALYQTAMLQSPKDPKYAFQEALALEKGGKHADAAAAFEKAATLDPKDSRAPLYAGLLYHQTGNDAKAVPELKTALALGTPEKFNAYSALAEAASTSGHTAEAIDDYALAAQAKPDDFGTQANLGVLSQNSGNKAAAEAAYRKAIALKASDPKMMSSVQSNLAILLIDSGRLDEAAGLLTSAAQADPGNADIQVNLGTVYEKQGKTAPALAAYKQALSIDPTDAAAKGSIARLTKHKA